MIDREHEPLLPLATAIERATGQRVHLTTALRWASRGSRGIRLETWVLGGRRLTSEAAVHRFVRASTEARQVTADTIIASPRQSDREKDRAAERLREMLKPSTKRGKHL
jgi:hypothetical protein